MQGPPPGLEGVRADEARSRLKTFGPNRLVRPAKGARLKEVARTLADPMALMLAAAAAVYLALGQRRDGIVLLVAMLPVLGVDVLLEARSRQALKKLAVAVAPRAWAVRDGREVEVPTEELVPEDLLVIREGDVLHADGIVRWAANLAMDESQLTGESEPQDKLPFVGESGVKPAEQHRFYAGSLVVGGHGYGEITTTGERTRYGNIARLVSETPGERTPLERKTTRMASRLLAIAALASAGIFLLLLARGNRPSQAFLYALSLAVSAVPEEFPLVFTLFLSVGAWRLSRHGVLVRRLASVETLGSTTVICLDKTGTLTRGTYALETHIPLRRDLAEGTLLEAAALACELNAADPIERAILAHCREHGIGVEELHSRWKLLYDYPFDMVGKHMSHVWASADGTGKERSPKARIVAKGALEGVLEHCTLAAGERERAEAANAELADKGMRVLAVAGRWADESPGSSVSVRESLAAIAHPQFTGVRDEDERELRLYGLLGFHDPLRPEVKTAVAECQSAGIKLKLITGDHALTAHAIAEAAGIQHEDENICTGADLDALGPDRLPEVARLTGIFARVRPEQKYAIVDALARAGEVVAMTGDGINDAPALRRADIGISMGRRGTQVARAAADLVLLEDDFGALVSTIREGRRVFANIQRAFFYLAGFKTMVVSLALMAPVLGLPVLLLLVQLVWLELIVHPVSALVFEGEPIAYDVMRRPPRPASAPLIPRIQALRSALSGGLLAAGALALYAVRLHGGGPYARSAAMAVVIGGCLLLVWAELAADRPWWTVPFPRSVRFWVVCILVAASLPASMAIRPLAALLQMGVISLADWGIVFLIILLAVGWRAFGWTPARE